MWALAKLGAGALLCPTVPTTSYKPGSAAKEILGCYRPMWEQAARSPGWGEARHPCLGPQGGRTAGEDGCESVSELVPICEAVMPRVLEHSRGEGPASPAGMHLVSKPPYPLIALCPPSLSAPRGALSWCLPSTPVADTGVRLPCSDARSQDPLLILSLPQPYCPARCQAGAQEEFAD